MMYINIKYLFMVMVIVPVIHSRLISAEISSETSAQEACDESLPTGSAGYTFGCPNHMSDDVVCPIEKQAEDVVCLYSSGKTWDVKEESRTLLEALREYAEDGVDQVKTGATSVAHGIKSAVQQTGHFTRQGVQAILQKAKDAGSYAKKAVKRAYNTSGEEVYHLKECVAETGKHMVEVAKGALDYGKETARHALAQKEEAMRHNAAKHRSSQDSD